MQSSLISNSVPRINVDVSSLNTEITKAEVEKCIFRAKHRKDLGLDNIPADILRNPICVELLFKINRYFFNTGTVTLAWNRRHITYIPKFVGKKP